MKSFFAIIILFLFVSCGIGDHQSPLNFSVHVDEPIIAEEVNFELFQKKVLLPKCVGCHKDWTSEEIVNRFTRENKPEESRLFTTIKNGSMPKNSPHLSSWYLEFTRDYISNIRYTPPREDPLPDDGQPVAFATVNEKVFKISCLPCHGQRALKDAESLAKSKWIAHDHPEQSKLLTSVLSGKMPKQRNLLTENQIELLRRYLRNFR